MQLANARLRLNKVGSDVPIMDMTPAEALLLHVLHQGNNGGSSFGEDMDKIKITGEAMNGKNQRTDAEEMRRLMAKYGRCVNKKGVRIIKLIWPELSPKLPQKFSELDWTNIQFDGEEIAAVDMISGAPLSTSPPEPAPVPAKK